VYLGLKKWNDADANVTVLEASQGLSMGTGSRLLSAGNCWEETPAQILQPGRVS